MERPEPERVRAFSPFLASRSGVCEKQADLASEGHEGCCGFYTENGWYGGTSFPGAKSNNVSGGAWWGWKFRYDPCAPPPPIHPPKGVSRVRLRKALAALTAALLFLVQGAGLAAPAAQMTMPDAVKLLLRYGVVQGMGENQDLRLFDRITRAQMAKVLVVALGRGDAPVLLAGAVPFPDTAGHWSAPYVAQAVALGVISGYPDGTFRPEQPVSYAEAASMLLRAAGQSGAVFGPWPDGVMDAAARLGILPAGLAGVQAGAPALRGEVFHMLALAATTLPVGPAGETLARLYLDRQGPGLALDPIPAEVRAPALVVSGTAADAAAVAVNGAAASLDAAGHFQATVTLQEGANTVEVVAADLVGNTTRKAVPVTYSPGPRAVRIEVTATAARTAVNSPVTLSARALDARGEAVPGVGFAWSTEGARADFDAATGRLMPLAAGTVTVRARALGLEGTATVTVTGAPAALRLSPGKTALTANGVAATPVTVEVVDLGGNRVAGSDLEVRLAATNPQVGLLSAYSVRTRDGVATVSLASAAADQTGAVTITARPAPGAANLTPATATVAFVARSLAAIKLEARPDTLPAGSYKTASVVAVPVDQDGVPMPAPANYQLTLSLANNPSIAVQKAGIQIFAAFTSSQESGQNGEIVGTGVRGSATVAASVAGGVSVPVLPATVTVTDVGATARLQVREIAPVRADGQAAMQIVVERRDAAGNLVGDDTRPVALTNPPAGVQVALVSDRAGVATFVARSTAPGSYTFTAAYPADSSVPAASATGVFLPLTAPAAGVHVELVPSLTAVAADGYSQVVVRGYLKDEAGGLVTNTGADLAVQVQVTGSSLAVLDGLLVIPSGQSWSQGDTAVLQATTVPGTAYVAGTITAGVNTYAVQAASVVVGSGTGAGYTPPGGSTGGTPGSYPITGSGRLLAMVDTGSPAAGAVTNWTIYVQNTSGQTITTDSYALKVRVYLNGQLQAGVPAGMTVTHVGSGVNPVTTPVRSVAGAVQIRLTYSTAGTVMLEPVPVDAQASAPGHDGSVGSARATTGFSVNSAQTTYTAGAAMITGALYDAGIDRLTIQYTTGAAYPAGSFDATKLTVGTRILTGSSGSPVASDTQAVFALNSADAAFVESPASMPGGNAQLAAASGWNTSGSNSAPATTGVPIRPWADVTSASYNAVADTLTLVGQGFATGTLAPQYLRIGDGTSSWTLPAGATVYLDSDTTVRIALGSAGATLEGQNWYNNALTVAGDLGWFTYSGNRNRPFSGIAVAKPTVPAVSSAAYDAQAHQLILTGSNLNTGTIQPTEFTVAGGSGGSRRLTGGSVLSNNGTQAVIQLVADDYNAVEDMATFAGSTARLTAGVYWNRDSAGGPAGSLSVALGPMARVSSASYNASSNTLSLSGVGFSTGTAVQTGYIVITDPSKTTVLRLSGGTPTISGDSSITLVLTDADAASLEDSNLFDGTDQRITFEAGWLVQGAGKNAAVNNVVLYR